MNVFIPEADLTRAVVRRDRHESGILNAIRRELALGRILAGQRLPRPEQLAARFAVDVGMIERVLTELHSHGMLVAGPSGEIVLREPDANRTLLAKELQTDPLALVRFTEYRAVLESGAAGLAAHRRTQADLGAMAAAQRGILEATDPVQARNADTAFHLAIAYATDNEVLIEHIEDARMEVIGALDLMRLGFIKVASYHGHEVIYRAILAGNSHDATEAMRLHIDTSRQEFQKRLDLGDIEVTATF
ncbi:MAG: FadR family transcriptional regulator [Microbacteriaceae bacterium]|nr:FadR family transcriptional regulator [Microbacteriaceae bacterium]